MGKRLTGRHFLNSVTGEGVHGCSYLLTVNIEMDPLDGFKVANWEKGFGDFVMRPDWSAIRLVPWHEKTVLVLCDLVRDDGSEVAEAPRAVLKGQMAMLAKAGLSSQIAGELEFYLFEQDYRRAWRTQYRGMTPSSDYRIDYHTLQPGKDEHFFGAIRRLFPLAGVGVESSHGEWGKGQHEVNLMHEEPVRMADSHVVFKHGVRELAQRGGRSVTFMSKFSPTEAGSSCHIHISVWRGKSALFRAVSGRDSRYFRGFLGGLLKYSRELGVFFAPTVNSYKRYQSASWAPTRMAWARDNRTTGFRAVGSGNSARIENRLPGADANPYLAFAAMLAAGTAGVAEGLDCGKPYEGNAYLDDRLPAVPKSLAEAAELLDRSKMARKAFGDGVVDFYVRHARMEAAAFDSAVTDWEKIRYFERI